MEEQIYYKDCILDEIYYSNMGYIMRHKPGAANNISIRNGRYHHGSGNFSESCHKIRLATPEEKTWFIACEKQGQFIPKEDIKSSDIEYPIGAYVVFLTVGVKKSKIPADAYNSIPTDYIYRLRGINNQSHGFYPEKDVRGSKSNGYSTHDIELRPATEAEIAEYQKNDAPCPAINLSTPQIINSYEIY